MGASTAWGSISMSQNRRVPENGYNTLLLSRRIETLGIWIRIGARLRSRVVNIGYGLRRHYAR